MRDNKIRLSTDVLDKAALIASEWGLKNTRAAVEAVFRRYADEYLYGRATPKAAPTSTSNGQGSVAVVEEREDWERATQSKGDAHPPTPPLPAQLTPPQGHAWEMVGTLELASLAARCEALDALDDLLGA